MLLKSSLLALAATMTTGFSASAQPLSIDFDEGLDSWRIVLDGVMGGRSTGRVRAGDPGTMVFTGDLSLENNGGFSQIRKNIQEGTLANQDGLEIKVLGDGRTYQFDIRVSNVRLMAGGFQTTFDTYPGEWKTIKLPFDDFRLYSFGRLVRNAPELDPALIESIGVTIADKKTGTFRIALDSIESYSAQTDSSSTTNSSEPSLAQLADAAGLNTLMALVAQSGIELPQGEQVTIFAPTDDAFAQLPSETVEFLTSEEGKDTLQSILAYHIVPGSLRSSDLLNRRTLRTLNGQTLDIQTNQGLSISGANFQVTDAAFDSGTVHVIDSVLIPQSKSILELASHTDELSTLATAIETAGIGDQLSNENGPWTVFAPLNSAFASLPHGVLDNLLKPENRAQLIDVLGLHVIPGRISSADLLTNKRARSYFGNPVEFTLRNGKIEVQGARIVAADIQAANGVIHLIDGVITKPSAPTKSSEDALMTSKSTRLEKEAIRLYDLAVERGVPLFNDGQQQACAFVYEVAIESMIALGADNLDSTGIQILEMGLAEAESEHNWTERAWIYRRAMDAAYNRFRSVN
ncbi:MAG: CIA30 family protein [Phycisphaerales bacterium]|nr:CIA30 family protein [Phycisphaerales bacterium]